MGSNSAVFIHASLQNWGPAFHFCLPSKLGSSLEGTTRVAMVREKYLENEIFVQVREKSGNFVDGQGKLERTWKVREFENKWL